MAGEKMVVAVPEYRQTVGPFDVVTMDTVRNIYQLGQALEGQGVSSQEEGVSFANFLKIDEDAFSGAPTASDSFPFQTRGNITVPIVQQMSSANLSNVLYPVFASVEALYHGYKNGYNGKIGEADNFIKNLFKESPLTAEELKKYFEGEEKKEAGGKALNKTLAEYDSRMKFLEEYLGPSFAKEDVLKELAKTFYSQNNIKKKQPSGNAKHKPKYKTENSNDYNSGYA